MKPAQYYSVWLMLLLLIFLFLPELAHYHLPFFCPGLTVMQDHLIPDYWIFTVVNTMF
jgi:hypothetical protein